MTTHKTISEKIAVGWRQKMATEIGDRVKCLHGDIDNQRHKGEVGEVIGFARLSSYHGREAMVRFADASSAWFWLTSLEPAS